MNNEAKHTPGPWRQGKVGDVGYSASVAPCHIWTSKGPGYGLVATTAPHCEPCEQQRIDACLIAAAPDLLAACEAAIPYMEECQPPETHKGSCGPESGCDAGCMDLAHWADDFHRLKKAIAKAKGESRS